MFAMKHWFEPVSYAIAANIDQRVEHLFATIKSVLENDQRYNHMTTRDGFILLVFMHTYNNLTYAIPQNRFESVVKHTIDNVIDPLLSKTRELIQQRKSIDSSFYSAIERASFFIECLTTTTEDFSWTDVYKTGKFDEIVELQLDKIYTNYKNAKNLYEYSQQVNNFINTYDAFHITNNANDTYWIVIVTAITIAFIGMLITVHFAKKAESTAH